MSIDILLIMASYNKIILFDIDYTLFDTDAYRRILYPKLAGELGIGEDDLRIFRREFEPEMKEKFGHFVPSFFFQKIISLANRPTNIEKLEKIFWDKKMYLAVLDPKSKEIIEKLQNNNVTIGLFSTGDKEHQLAKIESLLVYLPEENHHIFSNKIELIGDIIQKYKDFKVYLVDDLPEVLAKAKIRNLEVVTILRKTNKIYETTNLIEGFRPDYEIDNLSEIEEIVLK